jgi:hypothetical protein
MQQTLAWRLAIVAMAASFESQGGSLPTVDLPV